MVSIYTYNVCVCVCVCGGGGGGGLNYTCGGVSKFSVYIIESTTATCNLHM